MNFKPICLIGTVVCALFGLAFLLVPLQVAAIYGMVDWNPGQLTVARLLGVSMLYIAVTLFVAMILVDGARDSGRLYASDLAGAGVGALTTLVAFGVLGGERTVLVSAVLAAVAAAVIRARASGLVGIAASTAPTAGTARSRFSAARSTLSAIFSITYLAELPSSSLPNRLAFSSTTTRS